MCPLLCRMEFGYKRRPLRVEWAKVSVCISVQCMVAPACVAKEEKSAHVCKEKVWGKEIWVCNGPA